MDPFEEKRKKAMTLELFQFSSHLRIGRRKSQQMSQDTLCPESYMYFAECIPSHCWRTQTCSLFCAWVISCHFYQCSTSHGTCVHNLRHCFTRRENIICTVWYTRYEHKEVLHLEKAPGYKQNG